MSAPPNPETTPHDRDACKSEPCPACYQRRHIRAIDSDRLEYEQGWTCESCKSDSITEDTRVELYAKQMHLDCAVSRIGTDWMRLLADGGRDLHDSIAILREATAAANAKLPAKVASKAGELMTLLRHAEIAIHQAADLAREDIREELIGIRNRVSDVHYWVRSEVE